MKLMAHIRIGRLITVVSFFFIYFYFAKTSFVVNAQGAFKTYKGSNYTVNYPNTGFDAKLPGFINSVEKIIPFIETYGVIKFQNIQINLINQDQVAANTYGLSSIEKQIITLPVTQAFNLELVAHEFCHQIEHHLPFPAWFQEGQAPNCALKFLESIGRSEIVKYSNDYDTKVSVELKDIKSRLPEWVLQKDLVAMKDDKVMSRTELDAVLLFKDLLTKISMANILPKLREEYGIDQKGYHTGYRIPNNDLICFINSSTSEDVFSIFQKYRFKIPDCTGKPKPTPKPSPTTASEPNLVLIFALSSFLPLFIFVVFILFLIKSLINRKTKRKVARKAKRRK